MMPDKPLFDLSEVEAFVPKAKTGPARRHVAEANRTQMRLAKRASSAAEIIGDPMGNTTHIVSQGDWSAHDAIVHLLQFTGPAELWLATWSISDEAIRVLIREREAARVTECHFLLDWRVKVRNPKAASFAKTQADRLRVTTCHAKLYVVRGPNASITVSCSANLTGNPRIENYVITEGRALADFHVAWLDAELRGAKPFDPDPDAPTPAASDDE